MTPRPSIQYLTAKLNTAAGQACESAD
ncbi:hypothetical protein CBM2615_B140118 [Cupriavidus taiwanensis]|uniref:Uncharacterized protein n=1 Tax=Cupriavidus taiwanensis TaxID=164546 RepID=A0A375E5M7_9BURK|nr:hypothetical protein CBM2614_B150061 [Cupriavidus taiwanensis]SOZ64211.1 hypothetical protein CBM2615_B140118 [Cupriavidus taiwanensis]SOZ67978.1 hypothetical protein CBM2613_B110119 [Cupriavidus taiwanensis]SPA07844.1 hypothetical protein CBM2625_B110119 [Cupriavidus taiwanensis]